MSIEKNRARMYRAALEMMIAAAGAMVELLDLTLSDAANDEVDKAVERLGGDDQALILTLDDAIETVTTERNYYVNQGLLEEVGEATFRVKEVE